jgi:hypothetical protein
MSPRPSTMSDQRRMAKAFEESASEAVSPVMRKRHTLSITGIRKDRGS